MKRRSLTVLLCLLAIISLASVGFASWVISAGDTEEATGNIQVETVSDQRLEIVVPTGQDLNINLLAPASESQTITNSWLKGDGGSEKLSVVINFTIKYRDEKNKTIPTATVTAAWDEDTQSLLDAAVSKKYITAPTIVIANKGDGSYTATITFAWGELFKNGTENVNPYTYYNTGKKANVVAYYVNSEGTVVDSTVEGAIAVTWADDAVKTLTALQQQFNGQKYKLVISAEPSATPNPAA